MYNQESENDVLNCLQDVVKGFSTYKNKWFIKHLNIFEDNGIREFYNKQMEDLCDIPTRKDQEAMLIENGIWTQEQESKLNLTRVRLDAAKSTLPNVLIQSQKDTIKKQIDDLSLDYLKLVGEKNEYLGCVREDIANENTCEFIVQKSIFLDKDFTQKTFSSEDELYEMPSREVDVLKDYVFYIKMLSSSLMCKKIACSNTFQAIISIIPKGEEYRVFERPIIDMTSNQISLIQYGQIFRSIMENYDIPKDHAEDPEKILEIPKQAKKIQEMQEKAQSTELNSSYMGASSDEMRKMGMSGTDVFELLEKSGKKSLGKEDLI
jgi:hypothetical protein